MLSDILGDEDHLGDMDFKVTGTKDGITATQMDIKVDGLPYEVLEQALAQAKEGRAHIMGEMMKTISEPRADYRPNVPRIVQIVIPGEFIGAVIGTGGKVIQDIQKTTGTTITITEEGDKGIVDIFGENKDAMDAALARIKAITTVYCPARKAFCISPSSTTRKWTRLRTCFRSATRWMSSSSRSMRRQAR